MKNIQECRVLVIDDDVYKAIDITRALEYSKVKDVIRVRNQEKAFESIYENAKNGDPIDIIVTDMNYPLASGEDADGEAGFKLLARLKEEKISIPVIICSSRNYEEPEALGVVWYNELVDLDTEFRKVLTKLE